MNTLQISQTTFHKFFFLIALFTSIILSACNEQDTTNTDNTAVVATEAPKKPSQKVADAFDKTVEKAGELTQKAKEVASDVSSKALDKGGSIAEKTVEVTTDTFSTVKEKSKELIDDAGKAYQGAKEALKKDEETNAQELN